jgi:hypothetical protein
VDGQGLARTVDGEAAHSRDEKNMTHVTISGV